MEKIKEKLNAIYERAMSATDNTLLSVALEAVRQLIVVEHEIGKKKLTENKE